MWRIRNKCVMKKNGMCEEEILKRFFFIYMKGVRRIKVFLVVN